MILSTFGDRLRETRIEMGYKSQGAFAKKIGVSRVTVNYYENNERKPDFEMFAKIAKALDVPYEYLLGETNSKQKASIDINQRLGLSDKAIEKIEAVQKECESLNGESPVFVCDTDSKSKKQMSSTSIRASREYYLDFINGLNTLIENKHCADILRNISLYSKIPAYTDMDLVRYLDFRIKHLAYAESEFCSQGSELGLLNKPIYDMSAESDFSPRQHCEMLAQKYMTLLLNDIQNRHSENTKKRKIKK